MDGNEVPHVSIEYIFLQNTFFGWAELLYLNFSNAKTGLDDNTDLLRTYAYDYLT